MMIERELKSGSLVRLFATTLDDGRDYHLCQRTGADLSEQEMRFREWITAKIVLRPRN